MYYPTFMGIRILLDRYFPLDNWSCLLYVFPYYGDHHRQTEKTQAVLLRRRIRPRRWQTAYRQADLLGTAERVAAPIPDCTAPPPLSVTWVGFGFPRGLLLAAQQSRVREGLASQVPEPPLRPSPATH